ncbi:MAG: hypothetical protein GX856_08645 [Gammaproteobacteria bacterium]|nr:hypothetical protein [Gammaproteobacteria bacterium]
MRGLFVVVALVVAGPTWGQEPSAREQVCEMKAKIARGVMERRQTGFPVEDAMEIARTAPEVARDYYRATTLAAYGQDRWSTPTMRLRAVEDFGNEAYMECIRN